jgi:replication factor A1
VSQLLALLFEMTLKAHSLVRYILNLSVMDHTGHIWITAFNEAAESLLGKTADEMMELKDSDEGQFNNAIQGATGKTFTFSCSAKQDSYNVSCRLTQTPESR